MKNSILVIDDDRKLNELLDEYLSNYGFQVTTASRPEDGLRLLRLQQPELIILDVMLPQMDGFEVCKKIRMEYSIPIIMLTARGEVTFRFLFLHSVDSIFINNYYVLDTFFNDMNQHSSK